ncbi:hypothetical protein OF83DRAFT_599566 [Amylostereum chailletii]|nr:hypothetical protein OF83DRAFT_599566 [Amylostereum chailletii]
MASLSWPHLREFSLVGRFPMSDNKSIILSLLAVMPNLRILTLKQSRTKGNERKVVVPEHATLPSRGILRHLQELTLTYPNSDDAIFEHIPHNLRRLSLRDWMRHYCFHDPIMSPQSWGMRSPIPSSSGLLEILRRLRLPQLEELEIVYKASDDDRPLFEHIAAAYPLLNSSEIHRYRSESSGPPTYTFQPLSALRHLQKVRAYFNPVNKFHPYGVPEIFIPTAFRAELDGYLRMLALVLRPQPSALRKAT